MITQQFRFEKSCVKLGRIVKDTDAGGISVVQHLITNPYAFRLSSYLESPQTYLTIISMIFK